MKAQFSEGKAISEWIHPKHARKAAPKVDKRSFKQKLQFTVFCAKVVDKFWR